MTLSIHHYRRPLVAAALLLWLSACANLQTVPSSISPIDLPMASLNDDPGTQAWRSPNPIQPQSYAIATITWDLRGKSDPDASSRAKLESALIAALEHELGELDRVQPGAVAAIEIHAAITDIKPSNPIANILLSMLIGPLDTGGASISLLVLDHDSHLPLAALDTSFNGRVLSTRGFRTWGHAEQAFQHAANRLAELLEKEPDTG